MFEVYSEVRAILSENVISAIEGRVMETVQQCVMTASVEQITSENETRYLLCGTLDGILAAKTKLEELLNTLHIKKLAKESSERDSTTFSEENSSIADEGNTSYDKEGTDKTSCLSDDKERDTNASSNGYISTNTESSVKTLQLKPLSKKIMFNLMKERPRISQRTRAARLALQLRTVKKKAISRSKPQRSLGLLLNDPDKLSENLQHMNLTTEDSDFDSTECEVQNSRVPAENLSPKEKDYEASTPYKHFCELCSFKTKRSSHFVKHMAIHDKISTLHRCSQCAFTSVRLSHLRRHEMIHSSTVHRCTACLYKTDDVKFLLRHVKLKHRGSQDKNSSLVLFCPHCSYQTTKQHYYDRHQRIHCSKRNFLHQCEKCCYKTHRKEHLARHVNNVHGNKRPFLCHLCGKAFKRGDALLQHYQTHSELAQSDSSNYKCNVCEKSFRSHSHLLEHQAVHSETRLFLCEICGASFKTRSVHRKHVLSIHRNPRSYSCDACSKKFNTLFALKRHQKTHAIQTSSVPAPSAEGLDDTTKELETALTNLRTCCKESPGPVTSAPSTVVALPANPPHDAVSLNIASVQLPEVPVTGAELLQQLTPAFFQTSDVTTLLYMTNNVPQL